MRVVRIYHAGRDAAHRARDRALAQAGVDLRLVVPRDWPGPDDEPVDEPFEVLEIPVRRPGHVNRHRYRSKHELASAIWSFQPDLVDIHEEPVSLVARQVLSVVSDLPVVMYSAQNLDKRWPPPYRSFERQALARVQAFYPCSRQAASVLNGKGYNGLLRPLPLGIDTRVHFPGDQRVTERPVLGLVGRLVPEKGLLDAIEVLASLPAGSRLIVVGSGPARAAGEELARVRGLSHDVEWWPWVSAGELAQAYRRMHVLLVPSRSTATWVEQFGRVITEAGANGAVPVGYASGSIAEVTAGAGRVVPEGDVTALAAAVRELVRDADGWTVLREAGIRRAGTLDWTLVAQDQLDLYRRVAERPQPSGPLRRRPAGTPWGEPAATRLSTRPLAAPGLRSSARAHRLAESADRVLERLRAQRGSGPS